MQKNRRRGLKAKRNGAVFENMIERSCIHYKVNGIAHIQKTPEPFRIVSKQRNMVHGFFEKKAQPDFTGTLKGGQAIVFEAKNTDSTNIKFDRINAVQERDLDYHSHLGAQALILISFNLKRFYKVPWKEWQSMKDTLGKKSVNEKDLVDYQISTNKGLIDFLGE